jgi:hypothetical protein
VIATVWFAVVSALIVFVTTVFPSPATAKLYEMLADILMAAIEVALGLGLVQSFVLIIFSLRQQAGYLLQFHDRLIADVLGCTHSRG